MADEIRFSGSLTYRSGTKSAGLTGSGTADQSGTEYVQKTQDVGLTEEELDKGDIGTIAWVSIKNLDTTNYVEIGATTGVYSLKVPASGFAVAPWDGTTVFAKAHTAPCQIEYLLIEA